MKNLNNNFSNKNKQGLVLYLNIVIQIFGYTFFVFLFFSIFVFFYNPFILRDKIILVFVDYYFKHEIVHNPEREEQLDNLYRLLSSMNQPKELKQNNILNENTENNLNQLPDDIKKCIIDILGKEAVDQIMSNNFISEKEALEISSCFQNNF